MARYLIAWLPMIVLAVANGFLREFGYGRWLSGQHAHQLSTVTLILVFAVYVWLLHKAWPFASLGQALAVGLMWMVLTVVFEFALGRYGSRQSWDQLLQAYNLWAGNLWVLVPLAVAALPGIVYWWARGQ